MAISKDMTAADRKETMILMVEPETVSRYRLYRIPAGGIVDVGQA